MTSTNTGTAPIAPRARRRRDQAHTRIRGADPGSWTQRLRVLDYTRAVLQAGGDVDELVAFLDGMNEGLR